MGQGRTMPGWVVAACLLAPAACAPPALPAATPAASAGAGPAGVPAAASAPAATGPDQARLAEAATREIGFGSVAAAHDALAARGLRHYVRGTYEVFLDDTARTVWMFALPGSAAYPALVRRQLVGTEGRVVMRSAVFCEAGPAVCQLLQENIRLMDSALLEQLERRARPTIPDPVSPDPAVPARAPARRGVRV